VDIREYQKNSTRRSEARKKGKQNREERATPDNQSASAYSGYSTVKEGVKKKEKRKWATPGRRNREWTEKRKESQTQIRSSQSSRCII
jgi:hypothetical protein